MNEPTSPPSPIVHPEPEAKIVHVPLPEANRRRLDAAVFISSAFTAFLWVIGAPLGLIVGCGLLTAAWLFIRLTAKVPVIQQLDGSLPTPAQIESEVGVEPLPTRTKVLAVVCAFAFAGTLWIGREFGPGAAPPSPELVLALDACEPAWIEFSENDSELSRRQLTDCLIGNPALTSACGLGPAFLAQSVDAQRLDDIEFSSDQLRQCEQAGF